MARPLQISVVGTSAEDPRLAAMAEVVGAGIARAGARLVCGGRGGVMEAAARAAEAAGGEIIGILPTDDLADANPHVTHPVATGIGQARNIAVVATGDAMIAIGGAWGTLSEIAFARRMGRPVVGLATWQLAVEGGDLDGIEVAESPEKAVARALELGRDIPHQ